MASIRRPKSATNKKIPVFSHEFIIQNHGDIVSFFLLLIVLGLMSKTTSPVSSLFIALQYGQATKQNQNFFYTYGIGLMDLLTIFFYFLICILLHDIIQGFVLDKICRKLRLSKFKKLKFNESGMFIVFTVISMIWALAIIIKQNSLDNTLSSSTKLFYIIQLAYWLHNIPEFYFKKIKKEDMFKIVKYSVLNLAFIFALYITNFHHIGVIVLCLHYITEFTKHVIKLIDITEKEENSENVCFAQNVYYALFFIVQSLILFLSQTMLWYDFKCVEFSSDLCDFNTLMFKLLYSVSALAIQTWIVYEFFNKQKINIFMIFTSLSLENSKPFAVDLASYANKDNANKKLKNTDTATQIINESTGADQNIKKTLKKNKGSNKKH